MFATLSTAIAMAATARMLAAVRYRGLPVCRIVIGWNQCQCDLPGCGRAFSPETVMVGLN
jgi:hypothetical protein